MATLTNQLLNLEKEKNDIEKQYSLLINNEDGRRAKMILKEMRDSEKRLVELRKERLVFLASKYENDNKRPSLNF